MMLKRWKLHYKRWKVKRRTDKVCKDGGKVEAIFQDRLELDLLREKSKRIGLLENGATSIFVTGGDKRGVEMAAEALNKKDGKWGEEGEEDDGMTSKELHRKIRLCKGSSKMEDVAGWKERP